MRPERLNRPAFISTNFITRKQNLWGWLVKLQIEKAGPGDWRAPSIFVSYLCLIYLLDFSLWYFCLIFLWDNSLWYFCWIFFFDISGEKIRNASVTDDKVPNIPFCSTDEYCWSHSLDVEILLNDLELLFSTIHFSYFSRYIVEIDENVWSLDEEIRMQVLMSNIL